MKGKVTITNPYKIKRNLEGWSSNHGLQLFQQETDLIAKIFKNY